MVQKGSFTVLLDGRGPLTLEPRDHVGTGGEGSVYRSGNTVVKIYSDPQKMLREDMKGKLALLVGLTHPSIAAPRGIVLSTRHEPVGFYMDWVAGEPLPGLFTNDTRARLAFGDAESTSVAARMREAMAYAHAAGALMVDPNEFNWIVSLSDPQKPLPYAIDVDSWQIGRWPARVIMPSIQDHHRQGFDTLTDWFSWGVVTFQVYTGIHPYKGTVPGFGRYDLEARMKANASVFRPDARVNRAVRPWSVIPGPLLDWYVATFEQGERTAPPSPYAAGAAGAPTARTLRVVTTAQGALIYAKLLERPGDPIVRVFPAGLVRLASGALVHVASGRTLLTQSSPRMEAIAAAEGWLIADKAASGVVFTYVDGQSGATQTLTHTIRAERVVVGGERMFAVTSSGIAEILVRKLGRTVLVAQGKVWGVLPHALSWQRGVGILDALGAAYVIMPFGSEAVAQVRVPELDHVRVVAGVGYGRIATFTGVDTSGVYTKYDVLFSHDMRSAQVSSEKVATAELVRTVLPKGVVAFIEEDGELCVSVPTAATMNKVADKDIATDMLLARVGDSVVYVKDGALWSLRMK